MFDRVKSWGRKALGLVGGAVGVVAASAVVPAAAFAAGDLTFDPAPILAVVDAAKSFIIEVGLAVLIMIMVGRGVKWARKAG